MNRLFTAGTALSLTLMLGACQDSSEEGQNPDQEGNLTEEEADNVIAYDYFDLEVDYPDLEEAYAVEYEKQGDGQDVDITDKLTDKEYDAEDDSLAFGEIKPAFDKLDFNEDTPDEEVAQQLVDAFGLREDYKKIELEVDFTDGGEKQFTIENS
ncbi:hypothetical protein D3H55_18305 [Bacillus salacetis]|uniref:YusW-like protein n=1 Tax=Bacillus salacetis TaxID=2315464 RepID=A0A3A1QTU3_9BACI|nr:YusW family protein [Bacillus salacetis]RIW29731.1 hypothetical protein D3H55_18305 [Bacillus salacetis]